MVDKCSLRQVGRTAGRSGNGIRHHKAVASTKGLNLLAIASTLIAMASVAMVFNNPQIGRLHSGEELHVAREGERSFLGHTTQQI